MLTTRPPNTIQLLNLRKLNYAHLHPLPGLRKVGDVPVLFHTRLSSRGNTYRVLGQTDNEFPEVNEDYHELYT